MIESESLSERVSDFRPGGMEREMSDQFASGDGLQLSDK